MKSRKQRKSARLKNYDYTSEGIYFVTICTQDRECTFGAVSGGEMKLNGLGAIVQDEWMRTETVRPNVCMDEFVVMPNHFHGIITIVGATRRVAPTRRACGPVRGSVGAIVGQFKSIVTKRINQLRNTPGVPVWQRNYYDRVIRNENELLETRKYIQENPLKWDLDPENANSTIRRSSSPLVLSSVFSVLFSLSPVLA